MHFSIVQNWEFWQELQSQTFTLVVPWFQDMQTKQVFPTDCIEQLEMLPGVIYRGIFNPGSLSVRMNEGSFLPHILWDAGRGRRKGWWELGTACSCLD